MPYRITTITYQLAVILPPLIPRLDDWDRIGLQTGLSANSESILNQIPEFWE